MNEFSFPEMDPNRIITEENPMFYVILNVDELNKIDFNEVFNNDIDELRYSLDETKTFIKFRGELPNCLKNVSSKSQVYTSDEINDILHTEEWNF